MNAAAESPGAVEGAGAPRASAPCTTEARANASPATAPLVTEALPKYLSSRPELEAKPYTPHVTPTQPVPFLYFLSLLKALSRIKPNKSAAARGSAKRKSDLPLPEQLAAQKGLNGSAASNDPALDTVRMWIAKLPAGAGPGPQAVEPGTGATIFKLLFPDEDFTRVYGMKERLLGLELIQFYALSGQDKQQILHWSGDRSAELFSSNRPGCLGLELQHIRDSCTMSRDPLEEGSGDKFEGPSIMEVDKWLNELARHCKWSDGSIFAEDGEEHREAEVEPALPSHGTRSRTRKDPPLPIDPTTRKPLRKRPEIIKDLFNDLDANEIAFMVQIILKDLRPVIYPLPSDAVSDVETALVSYNTRAVKELKPLDVMNVWHPLMPHCFAVRGSLADAATAVEGAPRGNLWRVRDFGRERTLRNTLKAKGQPMAPDVKLWTSWEEDAPPVDWEDPRIRLQVGRRIEVRQGALFIVFWNSSHAQFS